MTCAWQQENEAAFDSIREEILENTTMQYFNTKAECELTIDVCLHFTGQAAVTEPRAHKNFHETPVCLERKPGGRQALRATHPNDRRPWRAICRRSHLEFYLPGPLRRCR
ncbi:hypothetical protein NDU88_006975 [Pleurodeles waltl]|uniref:Uncharacterized protein n=1 Tax=Pleurodeles waltl TaxID=8319 RepID=A0AAV7LQP7_PLEWA|nr:hypothetical protein NDU88_006975 [Pleurodeles waltl]